MVDVASPATPASVPSPDSPASVSVASGHNGPDDSGSLDSFEMTDFQLERRQSIYTTVVASKHRPKDILTFLADVCDTNIFQYQNCKQQNVCYANMK